VQRSAAEEAEARARALHADVVALAARVGELEGSTSWRVTAPLRRATDAVRGLRRR